MSGGDEGRPPRDEARARRDEARHHRREPRLRDIARRIFREPEGDERRGDGLLVDVRELVGAMLDTGDKAKTEIVRLVAREVRAYLDALELHKDLKALLTEYSLEVHASFRLRPIAEAAAAGVRVGARRRPRVDEAEPPAGEADDDCAGRGGEDEAPGRDGTVGDE